MSEVRFPEGHRLERLAKGHPRKAFACGQERVDDWLHSKALQHQEKRLSVTKVLVDDAGAVAGYYTLASGQVDFGDLPDEITRRLPRRMLPVAVLAWLGVATPHQGKGLCARLLARALRDCHEAGRTFPFIAVVLDCIDDAAKAFYRRFDFAEMPGHSTRLFLGWQRLAEMMEAD